MSNTNNDSPEFSSLQKDETKLFSPEDLEILKQKLETHSDFIEKIIDNNVTHNHFSELLKRRDELDYIYKYNKLIFLLNKQVPRKWIKEHPTVKIEVMGRKQALKFLPIDKIRFLLNRIFGLGWKDEIIGVYQTFNSVVVSVRLHFCVPGTGVWFYHDGIGAVAAQTNKDAAASDLGAIKSDAIMKAAPSAASYALSNAAEKLGDLFGANINKPDSINWGGAYDAYTTAGDEVPAGEAEQTQQTEPIQRTESPPPPPEIETEIDDFEIKY